MTEKSEVVIHTNADLPQWSPAWLRWIQSGINAQDIFSLACYSKALGFRYQVVPEAERPNWVSTPSAVYLQKTTSVKTSSGQDGPHRSKRLHPVALDGFNQRFSCSLSPTCAQYLGGIRVSLDGYCHAENVVVEVKSPQKQWGTAGLPLHVRLETHYQRAVAELCGLPVRKQGVIAVYEGRQGKYPQGEVSFDTYPVQYDPELGAVLIELACFFWDHYVIPRKAPPLQMADTRYRQDAEWAAAARAYRESLALHKKAELDLEQARERLLKLVGTAAEAIEGCGVRVCTVPRKGSIDYKQAVKVLSPKANLERFRADSSTVKMVLLVD